MSIFIIVFFIVLAVVFDMVGVAVTSTKLQNLEKYSQEKGFSTAKKLCKNTDKVSSFCGDVVGDICGILSGAGGVSLVVNMHISNPSVYILSTCLVSSVIAGLTIFGKAVMKGYAVDKCELVTMKTGAFLETSPFSAIKSIIKKFQGLKFGKNRKSKRKGDQNNKFSKANLNKEVKNKKVKGNKKNGGKFHKIRKIFQKK